MKQNRQALAEKFATLQSMIDGLSKHDDKPAIITLRKDGADRCSYSTLSGQTAKLAQGLVRIGLGRGDTVVLFAGNRPEWIVACLAAIRAGGVAVPLDTQSSDSALARVIRDSGARFVFTTTGELERLQTVCRTTELKAFLLDAEANDPRSWRCLLPESPVPLPECEPGEVAALFYTSGTTGSSKGVPLTHRNIVFQLNTAIDAQLVGEFDRVLLPLPLHHVYPFVIGMLFPLALGLPLIMPQSLTGPQILRAIRDEAVTALIGVPKLYEAICAGIATRVKTGPALTAFLLQANLKLSMQLRRIFGLRLGKLLLRPLHRELGLRLRIMASGGAALDPDLAWRLEAFGWEVAVGYGLTETSPLLTLDPPGKARIGTVGKAIPGVEIRIDKSLAFPNVNGQTGEVLARGPGVFAGYRNLPLKTAQAFTCDGWFRTGDLGFLDADGYLHITGRASTLIVTEGGEKIQPDEVEDAYRDCPVISEVGVLQRDGKLVAVIVPKLSQIHTGDNKVIAQTIREAIKAISKGLPSYQRITDFALTRDALARTRLGKIRRHLLVERYDQEKAGSAKPLLTGPMPVEDMPAEDLALLEDPAAKQVWDLLGRCFPDKALTPGTSPQLDLGIDSLDWLNLTLEIRERAGVELSEQAIGRINTVRDLLREVSTAGSEVSEGSLLEEPEKFLNKEQQRWLKPRGAIASGVAGFLFGLNWLVVRMLFRLRVKGLDNLPRDKPFVLIPNHLSYLDPQVIAGALGYRQVRPTFWAGWTGIMTTNPMNRLFSRIAQVVPIDPEHAVVSSLAFGAAVLQRGQNLVWFPEGELSRTGKLQPFKHGIGLLLERFQTLAIPVAIHGTDQAMPPGKHLPRPKQVLVEFGQAVSPRDLERSGEGRRSDERIVNSLHERVAALQIAAGESQH